jgi:hypothetical protein
VAKWHRVGGAEEFGTTPDGSDIDIGWSWRVEREGAGHRYIWVEVAGGRLNSAELPDESCEAIRTRGASAVDAVLDEDEPPPRLLVSSFGVRPRERSV